MKEIFKEQWLDQALHLAIGLMVTFILCTWFKTWLGVVPVALGWIAWEHSQYPNNNSKGYDDASIDRVFQELGIALGLWWYL